MKTYGHLKLVVDNTSNNNWKTWSLLRRKLKRFATCFTLLWRTPMPESGLKIASTIMATMLTTGLVAWFSFGGGVRAEEVKQMIQESPSVVELKERVSQVQKDLEKLNGKVEESNKETQKKLDTILQSIPRDERHP